MNRIIPDKFLQKCAAILILYQIFEFSLYALFLNGFTFPDFLYFCPRWAPTIISLFLFAISFVFFRKYKNYGFLCIGVMQILSSLIRFLFYIYESLCKIPESQPQILHTGNNLSEFVKYRSITYHVYILPLLFIIALAHFSKNLKRT